ncbi:Cupredoxin [Fragilariopsis cylindrus CCMP1102]|uniref:Cupredoxin n=1 Tax=Fragilariopsis cylindrus CCMP1102 TaxID=635003 RepID=A0A1E7ER37_9STRA|nr:Cupredoxin [Fragilariopsis cylindrus CCMP1102]|eukprot:OEU08286.1 Cupredoxin [Fragilariopsis cylindrus CCMP1102]
MMMMFSSLRSSRRRPSQVFVLLTITLFAFDLTSFVVAAAKAPLPRTSSSKTPPTDSTDFIDCNDPCNGGDVNYELIASVQTMKMNFGNYTYRGRTFARPNKKTGQIPEGDSNHMGPTMYVKPGQSLYIKFRNELYPEQTKNISPNPVEIYDYWSRLVVPGEKIKYQYYKNPVSSPELMEVDENNLPKSFDATNLHLHGLDIAVHMFDPVGTHNPEASHIAIDPGQCYCYKFQIPNDHPDGMYWYHPHLHGSSAIQLWSGMMGLLYIQGTFEQELKTKYNILDSREFVIWDPIFQDITNKTTDTDDNNHHQHQHPQHNIEVDEFLLGQTTLSKIHPFLVNGEITPLFDNVMVNQILHLRVLCATIENENTFIIYKYIEGKDYSQADWKTESIPFYQIASDGVTYTGNPIQRNIIVVAGGQREELFLQFNETGKYVISQQGIQGMQFFDMYGHPHDQLLAIINVVDDNQNDIDNDDVEAEEAEAEEALSSSSSQEQQQPSNIDIPNMIFTPGYTKEETIHSHQIVKTEIIVFSMGANRNQVPFPQYYVNGHSYSPNEINFYANPGDAIEYILINANHNVHPFHIHVNRFQVKEMGSELSTDKYPVLAEVMNFTENVWRDTVVIPPNGRTRIWVQYKNYTGKTVFHCHFLAHEDTGMMATLFIGAPDIIFHWQDHIPLLIGGGIGIIVDDDNDHQITLWLK